MPVYTVGLLGIRDFMFEHAGSDSIGDAYIM
jgi:hypothetical protein